MFHVGEQRRINYNFKRSGKILHLDQLGLDFRDSSAAVTTSATECGNQEKKHRLELKMSPRKVGFMV